jgi:hypothetical protein
MGLVRAVDSELLCLAGMCDGHLVYPVARSSARSHSYILKMEAAGFNGTVVFI